MKNVVLFLTVFLSSLVLSQFKIPPPSPRVSFTIGGDVMFDRLITAAFPGPNLPQVFSKLDNQLFASSDARLVNLEGPVSDRPLPSGRNPQTMVFYFPPESVSALRAINLNAVSLANNHTGNQGLKALGVTQSLLSDSDILPVGGPNKDGPYNIATFSGRLLDLVVIGINVFNDPPDITGLIAQIKSDPKNKLLIFPHWGAEYSPVHNTYQQSAGRNWIDAGADIVIGSHPHVIQDAEVYKGKPIIYSLGNLVFDQTFSKETQESIVVSGVFTSDSLQLSIYPIQITNLQPQLMTGPRKDQILSSFSASLGSAFTFPFPNQFHLPGGTQMKQ